MAKKEAVKKESAETVETVKAEPAKSESTKSPKTAKAVKAEPAAKTESVKAEPVKAEPVKTEAVKEAPKAAPKQAKAPSATAPLGHGVGRRKSSVARVWLRRGKGSLIVNKEDYKNYFDTEITRKQAAIAFEVYPQASKYDIEANVSGGGLPSQADAIKLGVARALVEINPELRPLFRQYGLLSVDSRVKERKKYGQKAARRKFQFVKR